MSTTAVAKKAGVDVEWLISKILVYCEKQAGMELYPYQREYAERMIESIILNDGEEITALFSRQCIEEGSIIHTREGELVRIEEHPDAWKTQEDAPLLEIQVRGGHIIRCTKNHPVMTDKGWILAGMLKEGDRVCILEEWDKFGDGVVEGSYVRYVNRYSNEVVKRRYVIDEGLAELVGWITADGSIRDGQSIKFTNNRLCYLYRVEELVLEYFPDITVKWYEKGNGYDLILSGRDKSRNSLKEFFKIMDYDCRFPRGVNKFTKEQVCAFFRGLFASDGHCYNKRDGINVEIGLGCKGKVYADYCRELLNKLGIRGQIKREWGAKSTEWFYKIIINGQRNVVRFKETIRWIPCKELPDISGYSRMNGREIFGGEDGEVLGFERVVSIRNGGVGDVWDVEYAGKGWFLCGGMKVHNSGKSETVAVVMAGVMVIIPKLASMPEFEELLGHFRKGIRIGLFAPSKEQAFTTFSRTRDRIRSDNAKLILNDPEVDTTLDKVANPMKLSNGSTMQMHSAARQSQIESKTYDVIIMEEAQDIDDTKSRKSIRPMGAATAATILMVGTPNSKRCDFLDAIKRNRRMDSKRRGGRKNHYEYDYTVAQKYNTRYKEYIKKEKQRLGSESDEFRLSYKLEWLLERGMFLSPQMKELLYTGSFSHKSASTVPCCVGIDIGKRTSSTVITVGEIDYKDTVFDDYTQEYIPVKKVIAWLEMYGDDYESQFYEAVDFLGNFNVKSIYVDSTAVGSAMADRLIYRYEGRAEVVPYDFSMPSKSKMWKLLRKEIENGRLKVPAVQKTKKLRAFRNFEQQMDDLEKEWKGQHLVCQKPKDDKEAKDDYCDSLGLMCLAAHHEVMPVVEEGENPFF